MLLKQLPAKLILNRLKAIADGFSGILDDIWAAKIKGRNNQYNKAMIRVKFFELLTPEQHEKIEDAIQRLLTEMNVEAKIMNEDTGNVCVSPRLTDDE